MDEKILYGVIVVAAVAVLAFSFLSLIAPPAKAQAGGAVAASLAQGPVPAECGDIENPKNLQHLSHHPDRFQECYKYVDPAKFKAAVGEDLSNFMR